MNLALTLLTIAGVHLLAVASPGPAFVSVLQSSVRHPRRILLMHVLGLGLAATTWAGAAILGMEAILLRAAFLYRILQAVGGAYLAWIGIKAWLHAKDSVTTTAETTPDITAAQALRRGFGTNIANPKVMVFFASIFTAVLKPGMPVWARAVVIAIIFCNETAWYACVGLALSSPKPQSAYRRAKTFIDRIAGTVMLAFGLKLLWNARRA